MLPEMDGFAVCRQIRENRSIYGSIPIIMLTARGDVTDRIVGLELGADDYLGKPFEPRELVARIENILRRSRDKPQNNNTEAASYTSAGLSVDYARRTVLLDNEPLVLTTMEFELLRVFIKSDGAVLSRDELVYQLRGIDAELYSRAVDTLVSRLRHKLKDTSKPARFIKTIWGKGYTFIQSSVRG
jgi:DNA-binding response OmpR family regulator